MAGPLFDRTRDVSLVGELLGRHGVGPSSPASETLSRYVELAAQWERRVDLTAARNATQLVEVLLLDALVLCDETLVPKGTRVLDVGAGVGAPTLPLLVLRDDAAATMVEPRRKRVAFLRTAIGQLGLAGRAEVRQGRIEPEAPEIAGVPFDAALARATFPPEQWLRIGLTLASRALVLTAGEQPPTPPTARKLADARYYVPSSGAPRAIAAYERVGHR